VLVQKKMKDFLDKAKDTCNQIVKKAFPEHHIHFEDVWVYFLPVFREWIQKRSEPYRFRMGDLLGTSGLAFADARDWSMPISLLTAVATMLDIRETRKPITDFTVRGTVRKYAKRFGAPEKLEELLVEIASPFCKGFYEGMKWDEKCEEEVEEMTRRVEATVPSRNERVDYVVVTHNEPEEPLTLHQLKDYKREHTPKDFFLWIDESEGSVFVRNKPVELEKRPRLRRVLRCLVELRGQCVNHDQLVRICSPPGTLYETPPEKLSRSWIVELRKAGAKKPNGKGPLSSLILTKRGGFVYEGPDSFCIIKPPA